MRNHSWITSGLQQEVTYHLISVKRYAVTFWTMKQFQKQNARILLGNIDTQITCACMVRLITDVKSQLHVRIKHQGEWGMAKHLKIYGNLSRILKHDQALMIIYRKPFRFLRI